MMASLLEALFDRRREDSTSRLMRGRVAIVIEDIVVE